MIVPPVPSGPKKNAPRQAAILLLAIGAVGSAFFVWWRFRGEPDAVPPPPGAHRQPSGAADTSLASPARAPLGRLADGNRWQQLDDPSRDGWDTEVLTQQVLDQLHLLGSLLNESRDMQARQLPSLATEQVRCDALLPSQWHVAYDDDRIRVSRAVPQAGAPAHGREALLGQLRRWVNAYLDSAPIDTHFKVVALDRRDKTIQTRVLGSCWGRAREQPPAEAAPPLLQHHLVWQVRWQVDAALAVPLLESIEVQAMEQVVAKEGQPLFADCSQAVLGHNACYRQQLLLGMNHWLERLQDVDYFAMLGSPGLAVADVNGDGLEDLYLCQEGGLPNRLFFQRPDGTASDASGEAGVDWLERSRSALLLDLDNDGDQDLAVAQIGRVVLAANRGDGRFEVRQVLPCGHDTMSLSAADYDQDGDLDLYVCVYSPAAQFLDNQGESLAALTARIVYHDANNAGRNSLFRNDIAGDAWQFRDVTSDVGIDRNNRRFSFAAAWEDYDNDGDQDLYVANDFGRNNLYRNQMTESGRARFVDVAAEASAEDSASGMSVSWADYDRDGWMDVYVSNMFSAAGSRITQQRQFQTDAPDWVKERLQRFARGNTLLQNARGRHFEDVSVPAGVTIGRWAWSSNFVDINNDGWEDLLVANGFITGEETGDL